MVRAKARIKTGYTCAVVPNYLKVQYACKMRGVHIRYGMILYSSKSIQRTKLIPTCVFQVANVKSFDVIGWFYTPAQCVSVKVPCS